MPWRLRFLTTRTHPLAYTAYACTFLLGLCLTFGFLVTNPVQDIHMWVAWLWKLELVTGGAVAFTVLCIRPRIAPRWPDLVDLLRAESIGAFVSGMGFIIYAYRIWAIYDSLLMPTLVLGTMGLGMLVRAGQAFREANEAEYLSAVYDEATEMLDRLQDGSQPEE